MIIHHHDKHYVMLSFIIHYVFVSPLGDFLAGRQLLPHDVLTHNIDMSSSPTSSAAETKIFADRSMNGSWFQKILHPKPVPFKSWCKIPWDSTGRFGWRSIFSLILVYRLQTNLPTKKVMQIAWPLDYWIRKNFRDILSKSWYSPRFIFRPTRTRVTNTKKHTTTRVILGDLKW